MEVPAPLRRHWVLLATALLFLAAGFLRFYRVTEAVHVDSLLWFKRARYFWQALAEGDWAATSRAPHPGVTMMWVAGAVMKLNGSMSAELIDERSLFALKFLGAMVGTLAASLTFPLLIALWGRAQWRPALLLSVFLTTEPMLIEQSRMAHLDMAALGFAWLGLLLSVLAYERGSDAAALGAGALFGLGVLTKLAIALVPAGLMLILLGTTVRSRLRDRRGLRVAAVATVAALATAFLLWPVLWHAPLETLKYVVTTSERVVEAGHRAVVNGRRTNDPGAIYYLKYVFSVTPYEVAAATALGSCTWWLLRDLRKHYGWLALAFVPYLIVICLAKKKSARYMLPASAVVAVLASAGVEWLLRRLPLERRRLQQVAAGVLVLFTGVGTARAVSSLPSAEYCTKWPGTEACGRPNNRHFLSSLAKKMGKNWRQRGREGTPRVYGGDPKLMAPWLRTKAAKSPRSADYVLLWDSDYVDAEGTQLGKKTRRALGKAKLGKELAVLRHHGDFVVRLYARAD
ncbi:MAG: hypothetical protein EOO73_28930 [Myxococcales bacterium]|nr:MAG: hypothetical protein EOO73_28930 [Myxococcales bacterium]